MALRLYDTMARRVRAFTPLTPGHVGVYLCGATVQGGPHIGHMRSGVNYDVLRRWLEYTGHTVTFIRNVTDIDDKILEKAPEHGVPWWAWAYAHERAFDAGYDALGCQPATASPRATGHIPEMIALMQTLMHSSHAYVAGGDVLFNVHSLPEYGALSRQSLEEICPAEDAPASLKRDPRDFALWKGRKPEEPDTASWDSPWGPGRPGWHLECSAMAGKYLGETFDIHGGGQDLIFPHHENEIAQSVAARRGFARYWVHHGLVSVGTEKMSKSVGNIVGLREIFSHVRPVELRYYLAGPHYRSTIEYTLDALRDAMVSYQRIEGFMHRAVERVGVMKPGEVPHAFHDAMNDDLATPAATAVLHDLVREGNTALSESDDVTVSALLPQIRAMLGVLGIDPLSEPWAAAQTNDLTHVVDALIGTLLTARQEARERRDYATADTLRDRLTDAGVAVEDTPNGPRWTIHG